MISSPDAVQLFDSFVANYSSTRDLLGDVHLFQKLHRAMKPSLGTSWANETFAATDKWALDKGVVPQDEVDDLEILSNFHMLFPSASGIYDRSAPLRFRDVSAQQADRMLQNVSFRNEIWERLLNGEIKSAEVSPEFIFETCLAATAFSNPNEKELITQALALTRPGHARWKFVWTFLRRRQVAMANKRKEEFSEPKADNVRLAVIVSGQMRSMDKALPQIRSYFEHLKPDYFVSSWVKPGAPRVERTRANRTFDEDATAILRKLSDEQIRSVDSHFRNQDTIDSGNMRDRIMGLFGVDSSRIRINLEDENEPIFSVMSNAEKMYYHNFYWPTALGNGYLEENFDYVVKIRPDINLKPIGPFDLEHLRSLGSGIATESPTWKYSTWGFGAGDQLIYGKSKVMESVLSIWYGSSISNLIHAKVRGGDDLLRGHANIGLQMWADGVDLQRAAFAHVGYVKDELRSAAELRNALEALGIEDIGGESK